MPRAMMPPLTAQDPVPASGTTSYTERLRRPALWLATLVFLATAVMWPLDITAAGEPRYLVFVLNLLFVGVASGLIAAIAARSFVRTGSWPVLWLGIGALSFGLAGMVGSWLIGRGAPNTAITVHNLGCLLAAALHSVGGFFVLNGVAPQTRRSGRLSTALQVYLGAVALFVVIVIARLRGVLPPFFIEGVGGTPLRQLVLMATALLFLLSGAVFWRRYLRSRSAFLYWYSLGLLLASLGMAGLLMQTATGTPLNWLGRGAQLLSGLYLLMAALVTLEEAKARHVSSSQALASFFGQQEASLRLLFESVMDAIITTDERFVITGWNQGGETTYGWRAAEVIGRQAAEVLPTSYPADLSTARVQEALLTTGAWSGEVTQRRRDGREIDVLSSMSALRDESGALSGLVAVNRDITERKQAEAALRESEERFRGLFETMQEGFALHEIVSDAEGRPVDCRFLEVNPAFERLTGIAREATVGRTVLEVLPGTESYWIETYGRVALTGEPARLEQYASDLSRYYEAFAYSPRRGQFAVIFSDVTARRQTQEALRESEAKYRDLFENMTEEVHFWQLVRDEQGRIKAWRLVDANPPTLKTWGKTLDEIRGKTTDEIFGPGATEHYMPVVQKIMTEGAPYSYEDYFPNLDKYFRFTSVPLGDRFITTGADITGIKQAAEQLRQSEERYRELVQNANSAIIRWRRDGTITFFNEYAQRFFGYSEEEAVGRSVSMLVPETESTGADLTALVQDIVDHPEAHVYNLNENVRRDGNRMWMAWTNKPILDADGQVAEVLAVGSDVTAQKEAADEVAQHLAVLQAIRRIFEAALRAESEEEVGKVCLTVAQELTGSQIGFVGQLGADGFLHDVAISDPGWSACTMYDQTGHRRLPGNFPVHGLYGLVLAHGKSFFTNDPAAHPDRRGLPVGHPPLTSFLGVPLLQAGQVVGMVAVANRLGGYTAREQHALEALAPAIVEPLQRKRAELALLVAERARADIAEQMTAEINHRMKNNFTLLSSVLGLQAMTLPQGSAAEVALRDAVTRLTALSVVHEQLFEARSARVDLRAVLQRIAQLDLEVTGADGVSLQVGGDQTSISSKLGSTLALVANELISNALKHGAPGVSGKLEVEVLISPRPDGLHLRVWNSGNPVPEALDVSRQTGMGLPLVDGVVTAQLHGSFTVRPERGGTSAEVFVPEREIRAAEFVPVGEGLPTPNV